MEIPVPDKSKYLKGLLIVAKKDNALHESEKKILQIASSKLGFATDFYEEIVRSLLTNKYIADDPITFSDKKIAESFIKDGLHLAYSDNHVEGNEIKWLKDTAAANGIAPVWFDEKSESVKEKKNNSELTLLSII